MVQGSIDRIRRSGIKQDFQWKTLPDGSVIKSKVIFNTSSPLVKVWIETPTGEERRVTVPVSVFEHGLIALAGQVPVPAKVHTSPLSLKTYLAGSGTHFGNNRYKFLVGAPENDPQDEIDPPDLPEQTRHCGWPTETGYLQNPYYTSRVYTTVSSLTAPLLNWEVYSPGRWTGLSRLWIQAQYAIGKPPRPPAFGQLQPDYQGIIRFWDNERETLRYWWVTNNVIGPIEAVEMIPEGPGACALVELNRHFKGEISFTDYDLVLLETWVFAYMHRALDEDGNEVPPTTLMTDDAFSSKVEFPMPIALAYGWHWTHMPIRQAKQPKIESSIIAFRTKWDESDPEDPKAWFEFKLITMKFTFDGQLRVSIDTQNQGQWAPNYYSMPLWLPEEEKHKLYSLQSPTRLDYNGDAHTENTDIYCFYDENDDLVTLTAHKYTSYGYGARVGEDHTGNANMCGLDSVDWNWMWVNGHSEGGGYTCKSKGEFGVHHGGAISQHVCSLAQFAGPTRESTSFPTKVTEICGQAELSGGAETAFAHRHTCFSTEEPTNSEGQSPFTEWVEAEDIPNWCGMNCLVEWARNQYAGFRVEHHHTVEGKGSIARCAIIPLDDAEAVYILNGDYSGGAEVHDYGFETDANHHRVTSEVLIWYPGKGKECYHSPVFNKQNSLKTWANNYDWNSKSKAEPYKKATLHVISATQTKTENVANAEGVWWYFTSAVDDVYRNPVYHFCSYLGDAHYWWQASPDQAYDSDGLPYEISNLLPATIYPLGAV